MSAIAVRLDSAGKFGERGRSLRVHSDSIAGQTIADRVLLEHDAASP